MNRFLFIIIFFLFLPSCSVGSIYSELFNNFKTLFSEPDDVSIEEIQKIKFATMQARIGRSNNSIIVLEEDQNGILKWTSSNLIKIYTRKGYVVRLTGLGNELESIELDRYHPILSGNFDFDEDKIFTSFYTFDNPKLFRLPVKTKISFVREEEITILGKSNKVRLFEEKSMENLISWDFLNLLWVSEEGYVIKSRQSFTPKNPEIYLMQTKKYAKPN
jgi:hypothetical protein